MCIPTGSQGMATPEGSGRAPGVKRLSYSYVLRGRKGDNARMVVDGALEGACPSGKAPPRTGLLACLLEETAVTFGLEPGGCRAERVPNRSSNSVHLRARM